MQQVNSGADQRPSSSLEAMSSRPLFFFLLIALMAITYVFYGWDRLVMPMELVELRRSLSLDQQTAGLMASIFTLGIAALSLPAGFLVAHLGLRAALGISTLVFSCGTLVSGIASNTIVLLCGRLLTGAGESIFSIALFMLIVALFPRWKGTAVGGATTIFGLSMFFGPRIILQLGHMGGGDWRFPFKVLGMFGFSFGVLLLLFVPSRLKAKVVATTEASGWAWVLAPGLLATYCLAAANGLCCYAYMSLFQTYARIGQHLSPEQASLAFGVFGIGNIVGGIPIGLLLDKTDRRTGIGVLSILTGISGSVLFLSSLGPASAIFLSLIYGIGVGGVYGNCYALAREMAPAARSSLAIGALLTVYYLFASVSGYFFVLAMGDDFLSNVRGSMLMFLVPYVTAGVIMLLVRLKTGVAASGA